MHIRVIYGSRIIKVIEKGGGRKASILYIYITPDKAYIPNVYLRSGSSGSSVVPDHAWSSSIYI